MSPPSIAALTIVHEGTEEIHAFVDSWSFCGEVVIAVDNNPALSAALRARRPNAAQLKVVDVPREGPIPDFSSLRNRALESSTAEYVIHLDSDMRATAEFQTELRQALSLRFDAYTFSLEHYILGRVSRSDLGRLWRRSWVRRREFARFVGSVHERMAHEVDLEYDIQSPVTHLGDRSFYERALKNAMYSKLYWDSRPQATVVGVLLDTGRSAVRDSLSYLISLRGYRDGLTGLVWTLYILIGTFMRGLEGLSRVVGFEATSGEGEHHD